MPLISGGWGLSLALTAAEVGIGLLVTWTVARSRGFGDEFVDGLKALPQLALDALRLAATPGGGRS